MPRNLVPTLLALAVLAAGCARIPPGDPIPRRRVEAAAFEPALLSRAVFAEVNRVRAAFGRPAVGPNRDLDSAADEQVAYLVLIAGVEHTNLAPGEETPAARVAHAGIAAAAVGENAVMMPVVGPPGAPFPAYDYPGLAAAMVESWMNSPGHRANILKRDFQISGVATRIGRGPRGSFLAYAVQVFVVPETLQGIPEGLAVPRVMTGPRRGT